MAYLPRRCWDVSLLDHIGSVSKSFILNAQQIHVLMEYLYGVKPDYWMLYGTIRKEIPSTKARSLGLDPTQINYLYIVEIPGGVSESSVEAVLREYDLIDNRLVKTHS